MNILMANRISQPTKNTNNNPINNKNVINNRSMDGVPTV